LVNDSSGRSGIYEIFLQNFELVPLNLENFRVFI